MSARPAPGEPVTIQSIKPYDTGHPVPGLSASFVASVPREVLDVLNLAEEWRKMQAHAGHVEINAKLAELGQAVDRYIRTR